MNTTRINASKEYNVITGKGLLSEAGQRIIEALRVSDKSFSPENRKAVIVSDSNVYPLYGDKLKAALTSPGFKTLSYIFPAGEKSKSLSEYGSIMRFFSENGLTRNDIIITLGGGVAGDLGGFAASTYMRGTKLVHCPTTLLAAVDSSVGGKTGINLETAKNQIGSFFQPDLVLCDLDCLSTLPEREMKSGYGEIIKYSAIENTISEGKTRSEKNHRPLSDLIREANEKNDSKILEEIINRCVSIKRDFVAEDEFDNGRRAILNFGHTFGHAVEHLSGYKVSHGEAVAIGMSLVSEAACRMGLCSAETADQIVSLIKSCGLPTETEFSAKEILSTIKSDKKNDGKNTKLIAPVDKGVCKVINIPNEELTKWIISEPSSDYVVKHGSRIGDITVPPSKSYAHRHLICSGLAGDGSPDKSMNIEGLSDDVNATAECIKTIASALGSEPPAPGKPIVLKAEESGSTFRFLLPVVTALGLPTEFVLGPGLAARPHRLLIDLLAYKGADISVRGEHIFTSGKIEAGEYTVSGNISSQYVSGLLMALPLLDGDSTLKVNGPIESLPYIHITEAVLKQYGIFMEKKTEYKNKAFSKKGKTNTENQEIDSLTYFIPGNQKYRLPSKRKIEGDWSAGAVFLCLGALSKQGITVRGLDLNSLQGDRAVVQLLSNAGAKIDLNSFGITVSSGELKGQTIDAAQIPDLVPVLSVVAAVSAGKTKFKKGRRLRFKESDRIKTTAELINSLGGKATETSDGLVIDGRPLLEGGTAGSFNDHRIVMAAAVAASASKDDVVIKDGGCISKSYPEFFEDLNSLEVK